MENLKAYFELVYSHNKKGDERSEPYIHVLKSTSIKDGEKDPVPWVSIMGQQEENVCIGFFPDGIAICKNGKCINLKGDELDQLIGLIGDGGDG